MTGWSVLPGRANNGLAELPELPPLPSESTNEGPEQPDPVVYIQLTKHLSLVRLAASLGLEPNVLAELNGQNMLDEQPKGSWWAVPAQQQARLLKLTTVDPASIRIAHHPLQTVVGKTCEFSTRRIPGCIPAAPWD